MGLFPAELQSYENFADGISANPMDADVARQLSDFLMSTSVDEILAARGIERR
jgi:molybdate transport system substrate-binding protein